MGGNTVIEESKVIENTFTPGQSRVFPAPVSTIAEEMAETSGLTLARYEGSRQRNGSLIVVREGGRGGKLLSFYKQQVCFRLWLGYREALQSVF